MYFQANSIFFIPFTLVLLLEIVATTTIKNSRQKQVTINYKKDLIFFVATTQPNYTVGFGNVNPRTWEKLAVDFVKRSKSAGVKPRFAVGGWTDSRYLRHIL
ncbi:hypothetical protein CROQUDRAFT_562863 [Cronartium quercuum f. sp. fusiforme G11]|uniref:Uncharacterized protein n=1 Tax=Cronartium quercuum f. sp. fusiforme G11 TaxID=708437 RepID=A0A9P6N5D7_9BASI|nr:hypothetical protein CROQUDRAFT_562863 [Cronartium quercuum f. sp. fusiforme G11]